MSIKEIINRIPFIVPIYRWARLKYATFRLRGKSTEDVFTDIFARNGWKGKESVSGTGSDIARAQRIIEQLPVIFGKYQIKTMLDLPCGDFNWMRHVPLDEVDYTGADIVRELIATNTRLYETDGIRFKQLDLIRDSLPTVDLILCRDCLVHLSFDDVFLALENICRSQSRYLLATTFTERRKNQDIATGMWRPLNLVVSPCELPQPLELINEGCEEGEGAFRDKSLGLWRISDIRESLRSRSNGRG